jgi:hypothetical protein
MKIRPLFFILHGLLNRNTLDVIPRRHVVIGSNSFEETQMPYKKICFTFDDSDGDTETTTHILLPRLIDDVLKENKAIPAFHPLSLYHFSRYENSALSSVMSYPVYCLLEEKMANIVYSYLNDVRNHWMIMMDPFFIHRDGFRSYGLQGENNNAMWITPSVELDGDQIMVDITTEDTGII